MWSNLQGECNSWYLSTLSRVSSHSGISAVSYFLFVYIYFVLPAGSCAIESEKRYLEAQLCEWQNPQDVHIRTRVSALALRRAGSESAKKLPERPQCFSLHSRDGLSYMRFSFPEKLLDPDHRKVAYGHRLSTKICLSLRASQSYPRMKRCVKSAQVEQTAGESSSPGQKKAQGTLKLADSRRR